MKKIDKIDIKRQITKIEKLTKVVKQEQEQEQQKL